MIEGQFRPRPRIAWIAAVLTTVALILVGPLAARSEQAASTVTPEQRAYAFQALCGGLVSATVNAPVSQGQAMTEKVGIIMAERAIAKHFSLPPASAHAILVNLIAQRHDTTSNGKSASSLTAWACRAARKNGFHPY